jgi:D-sedoheptulose 7-phosphate isomerase
MSAITAKEYFKNLANLVFPCDEDIVRLELLINDLKETKNNKKKVIIVGNGGSAAIASHFSVDLSKNAKIRAVNFNEADLITCLSNDASFSRWISEALKLYADPGDLVILISSSGMSENMLTAASYCLQNSLTLVTFTGMTEENKLKRININGLNFWVDSKAYNHIENVHQAWLLFCVDACIGGSEYSAKI